MYIPKVPGVEPVQPNSGKIALMRRDGKLRGNQATRETTAQTPKTISAVIAPLRLTGGDLSMFALSADGAAAGTSLPPQKPQNWFPVGLSLPQSVHLTGITPWRIIAELQTLSGLHLSHSNYHTVDSNVNRLTAFKEEGSGLVLLTGHPLAIQKRCPVYRQNLYCWTR